MKKYGKALTANIHMAEDKVLYFAPKPGSNFISWEVDDLGYLALESGEYKVIFAAGEWQSVDVDEYHLKRDMH